MSDGMHVVVVNDPVSVHIPIFDIARSHFGKHLLRTIGDIRFIPEITDCFQTKKLSSGKSLAGKIVVGNISFPVFYYFSPDIVQCATHVVSEVFSGFVFPVDSQFNPFVFGLTVVLLRYTDTDGGRNDIAAAYRHFAPFIHIGVNGQVQSFE